VSLIVTAYLFAAQILARTRDRSITTILLPEEY